MTTVDMNGLPWYRLRGSSIGIFEWNDARIHRPNMRLLSWQSGMRGRPGWKIIADYDSLHNGDSALDNKTDWSITKIDAKLPMHDTSSEVHGSTITVHNSTNSYTQHDVQRLRLVRYWRERLTSRVRWKMLIYQWTSAADITNFRVTIDHTDFFNARRYCKAQHLVFGNSVIPHRPISK